MYVTTLLAAPANVTITSGGGESLTFAVPAGLASVQVPAAPGAQRFELERGGRRLVDIIGAENINSTALSSDICTMQTFTGTARLAAP